MLVFHSKCLLFLVTGGNLKSDAKSQHSIHKKREGSRCKDGDGCRQPDGGHGAIFRGAARRDEETLGGLGGSGMFFTFK